MTSSSGPCARTPTRPSQGEALQDVFGRHQRLRIFFGLLIVGTVATVPWIHIGGLPLARFELATGRYFLAGRALPASSLPNVVLLVFGAALGLGWVSSLWGRLWCGYACPQGHFVDLGVRALERLWKGPPQSRARLERARPLWARRAREAGLHVSLLGLSVAFSFVVLSYFAAPQELVLATHGATPRALWIVGGVLVVLAYVDATWLRARFCTTLCPYARLQMLLVDEGTRQLGYDSTRGEPRGRGFAKGDCVDCRACVRVCPTAIDIRQGAGQLECVNCARCLDVCDGVMSALGRPKGLIRFDTEEGFRGVSGKRERRLRPRPLLYAVALTAVLGVGVFRFVTMPLVQATAVNVTPNGFVVEGARVKNLLRVRVSNLSRQPATFELRLAPHAPRDARIEFVSPSSRIAPGESAETSVLVSKEGLRPGPHLIPFTVASREDASLGAPLMVPFATPGSAEPEDTSVRASRPR